MGIGVHLCTRSRIVIAAEGGLLKSRLRRWYFLFLYICFWYNNGDCWWRTGAELVKKHDGGKIVKRDFNLSLDVYFMCIWCLCWSPDAIFMFILYFLVFIWTGDACWTECFWSATMSAEVAMYLSKTLHIPHEGDNNLINSCVRLNPAYPKVKLFRQHSSSQYNFNT